MGGMTRKRLNFKTIEILFNADGSTPETSFGIVLNAKKSLILQVKGTSRTKSQRIFFKIQDFLLTYKSETKITEIIHENRRKLSEN